LTAVINPIVCGKNAQRKMGPWKSWELRGVGAEQTNQWHQSFILSPKELTRQEKRKRGGDNLLGGAAKRGEHQRQHVPTCLARVLGSRQRRLQDKKRRERERRIAIKPQTSDSEERRRVETGMMNKRGASKKEGTKGIEWTSEVEGGRGGIRKGRVGRRGALDLNPFIIIWSSERVSAPRNSQQGKGGEGNLRERKSEDCTVKERCREKKSKKARLPESKVLVAW